MFACKNTVNCFIYLFAYTCCLIYNNKYVNFVETLEPIWVILWCCKAPCPPVGVQLQLLGKQLASQRYSSPAVCQPNLLPQDTPHLSVCRCCGNHYAWLMIEQVPQCNVGCNVTLACTMATGYNGLLVDFN